MKTVFINCSPKKRFCASSYFLGLQRLFVKGTKVTEKLRNRNDHERILTELSDADAVVFCLPLYVDIGLGGLLSKLFYLYYGVETGSYLHI